MLGLISEGCETPNESPDSADPAKVTRSAPQNAASIAVMVLTTEAVSTEIPPQKGTGGGATGAMSLHTK